MGLVSESDIGRCASEDSWPIKGVDCEISYKLGIDKNSINKKIILYLKKMVAMGMDMNFSNTIHV